MTLMAVKKKVQDHILAQFESDEAQRELKALGPKGTDWSKRTRETLEIMLPELPKVAVFLATGLSQRLNCTGLVLKKVKDELDHMKTRFVNEEAYNEWAAHLDLASELIKLSGDTVASQQVSGAVSNLILSPQGFGKVLKHNGNSVYPDLLRTDAIYSGLPRQSRSSPIDGPCLRGQTVSNVPDGCEIKTNRGKRMKIDAHGAHAGLHLGVTWDFLEGNFVTTGVWAAYVRVCDHRTSGRNVNVTTVKYSFGHDLFVSLLG